MAAGRPIIKLQPTKLDLALDRFSLIILISTWIYTIINYNRLPQIIPSHFDLHGNIDEYRSKGVIFILPIVITIVLAGMTVLNNYPHIFNYMQKITSENAQQQYAAATRLMRVIKLIISVFCLVIMIDIIKSAMDGHSKLQWWIIPLFMFSMVLPVIISLTVWGKAKKK